MHALIQNPLGFKVEILEKFIQGLNNPAQVISWVLSLKPFLTEWQYFQNIAPAELESVVRYWCRELLANTENPELWIPQWIQLGQSAQKYGFLPEFVGRIRTRLLALLREDYGTEWSLEIRNSWLEFLNVIFHTLLKTYQLEPSPKEHSNKFKIVETPDARHEHHPVSNLLNPKESSMTETIDMANDLNALRAAVDNSSVNIMMCDRDLRITYVSKTARSMFKTHLKAFQTRFRDFHPDKLIGRSIDDFHQDPSRQRSLLGNPSNLPYSTEIDVMHLIFRLSVNAIIDGQGNYIGATLEWKDISKERSKEQEAARLSCMIEESTTNFMVCDTDFKITYCNPSVLKMMRQYTHIFKSLFPGFDVDKLIGRNLDEFHKNPAHQRSILGNPRNLPYKTEISVGGLAFGLNAMALRDKDGNHIGNGVEWVDYNERAIYKKEINRLLNAVTQGQLHDRGNVAEMPEAYKPMITNINQIIEAIVEPIGEIREKLAHIARGDVNAYVTGEYKGDHAMLKNALNTTLDSLRELSTSAETISEGDLTVNIIPKSDVDAMGNAILKIVDGLNDMLGQIQQASIEIAEGSRQIADSSQALAQGATEQAASVEQISASIAEMSSQTEQNAQNADQANKLAKVARESAEVGDQQMKEMTVAMAAIDDSSQNISKIIKVIDEIAFQTNLLALNAAVEAARAGTHGKGFAVVANEVRNLAARSAQAAKETTEMIGDSIKKVRRGIEIADKTADALTEIVNSITKVRDLVSEITAASREQASGISQINQGLNQIEQVTQQNSASSEQSAAAAEELSGQSIQLKEQLSRFRLKEKKVNYDLPMNIPPEMMQAFQQYLAQTGGGRPPAAAPKPVIPAPAAPRPNPTPKPANLPPASKGKKIHPSQVIQLDDDEFGKY
ncbi:MAG: PAS domain-containing protein [SAR324 cluster bacterium]|nr:PAS domain-containing protein [SAR324 cluster bacterium]